MKAINLSGIFKGCVLSVLVSFIFILGLSVASYFASVSNTVVTAVIFGGVIIGVFLGSFAVGKGAEHKKLIHGLLVGALYVLVLTVLSLILNGGGGFHMRFFSLAAGCLLAGGVGGLRSL